MNRHAAPPEQDHRHRSAVRRRAVESQREKVTARVRPTIDDTLIAVLPANDDPTVRLGERRRRSLRTLLTELVRDVQQSRRPATPVAGDAKCTTAAAELALLHLGCATCRGHCCAIGADHALLDADTIRRYWRAHPKATAEDVVSAYVDRLPTRSVRRSCLFHGRDGCTLTRDMRSDICNDFYCKGLLDLRAQLSDPTRQSVLAINMESTSPRRAALYDRHGIRRRFRGKQAPKGG